MLVVMVKIVNQNFRAVAFSLSLVTATVLSSSAMAQIPSTAFKEITKFFHKGMESYSPVVAKAASDKGWMHNFRFYGNFISGQDKDGKRSCILDNSKDALWTLAKNLYPCPAGHLATDTNAAVNFGHHVTNPKTMALLLNYAKNVRRGNASSPLSAILETLASEEEKDLQQKMRSIFTGFVENNRETLSSKLRGQEAQKKRQSLQNALISELQVLGLKDKTGKELDLSKNQNIQEIVKKVVTALEKDPNADLMPLFEETVFKGKFTAADQILKSIRGSIEQEKEGFYGPYTTEQLLNIFFCEKFNNQKDIFELIKELDGDIVDKGQLLPTEEDLLTAEYIQKIAKKTTYTLDDIYALS